MFQDPDDTEYYGWTTKSKKQSEGKVDEGTLGERRKELEEDEQKQIKELFDKKFAQLQHQALTIHANSSSGLTVIAQDMPPDTSDFSKLKDATDASDKLVSMCLITIQGKLLHLAILLFVYILFIDLKKKNNPKAQKIAVFIGLKKKNNPKAQSLLCSSLFLYVYFLNVYFGMYTLARTLFECILFGVYLRLGKKQPQSSKACCVHWLEAVAW